MSDWTINDIPSLAGKLAVVTGATGGLGFETSLALAAAGAEVVLTGRNDDKGSQAIDAICAQVPNALISYQHLDLASLASVANFARRFAQLHGPLDLLVNNAGVMALPTRQTTADGFEMQFGTNYLGHYALTAHLLPALRRGSAPRVVQLSSTVHRVGVVDFDDLQGERSYRPWKAYSQSKLAMLMFALELQRRSDVAGWGLISNAAHPGSSRTDLISNGPGNGGLIGLISRLLRPLGHSAAAGALPTLFAATAPAAVGGGYYGPSGIFELSGPPAAARIVRGQDAAAAARLWDVSAVLTGASFDQAAVRVMAAHGSAEFR
ncbi:MAG: SDR family oxidoreductase [Tardiphaga sp.]